jgi:hypothetical protein
MTDSHRLSTLSSALSSALSMAVACALALSTAVSAAPQEVAPVVDKGDPWRSAVAPPEAATEHRVIGRVVGLRGRVYAQSPGQERRLLVENGAIFPGDRLTTSKGGQLGVLSGDYYTGLSEDTTLTYSKRGNGAPSVSLERGDVRVINSGSGENAEIATPGMLAANAGADTSAFAVTEKAWVVSMVCATLGQVEVGGTAGGQPIVVDEGGCAASKPAEGIFMAGDAGPPLVPVSAGPLGAAGPPVVTGPPGLPVTLAASSSGSPVGDAPPSGSAAERFAGPVDSAPPGFRAAIDARRGIRDNNDWLTLIEPCDRPGTGCGVALTPPPLPPTIRSNPTPPVNGWVPGQPPPTDFTF